MFTSLLAAIALVQYVLAAPPQLIESRLSSGPLDERANFYYSFWSEGGNYNCQNGPNGQYSIKWGGTDGGFVCGKGWNTGGSRAVTYSGTYSPKGPGYLSLYGWTKNPLVEYYIVDSYDILDPGEPWTLKGNFTFGEGTYQLYSSTRVNKPSIVGTATFQQYWSVRTEKRVGGTITTQKHYDAWSQVGMRLGQHQYMIIATEGFTNGGNKTSGSASITVQ